MNGIKFKYDDKQSMYVLSDGLPIKQVYTCYDLEMYWVNNKQRLLIGQNDAGEIFFKLESMLSLALQQQLKLDPSIQKSLGYYWNEIFADRGALVDLVYEYDPVCKYESWIGTKYYMICTVYPHNPTITTWIYNNEYGDIILEVTPMFVWAGDEVTTQEELNRYFAFLKDYKPILQQIIPQAIAQEWLEQAQKWYKVFYDNEQKDCGR